tara:strand:+ start:174 stop:317 length:144 start_codon:yes stop_codon:yes gene_type:complete
LGFGLSECNNAEIEFSQNILAQYKQGLSASAKPCCLLRDSKANQNTL